MEISRRTVIVAIIIILALLGVGTRYAMDQQAELLSWRSAAESYKEEAKTWKNKDGSSQATIRDMSASIEVIRKLHSKELDSANNLIKGLRKDLKNLQSFTSVNSSVSGSISAPTTTIFLGAPGQTPRLPRQSFSYSDRWTSISGYFLRDSVHLDYTVRDEVSVVQYWKRSGLFSPRELYTDVISKNPNSMITKLSSTTVRPKKSSRFGIDVFGGYAPGAGVVVGIGVGYRLIEF